jgi:hypothetical protein
LSLKREKFQIFKMITNCQRFWLENFVIVFSRKETFYFSLLNWK